MKTTQLFTLALMMLSIAPARAEFVSFSWWDERYATPGLYSDARGGYSRDAKLPDEPEIHIASNDTSVKTNREVARVLVVPPGSNVVGPDPFNARAQSDFGRNHAETQTFLTGFGETEDKKYSDVRSHAMYAESIWADRWTFSGVGLGTTTVALAANFEASITGSPCSTGNCGQVANPIFDRQGLHTWWYRLYGSVRVFDLDVIDQLVQPDSDYTLDVPREVGAFEVFQQGSNIAADSFGPLEPYPNVLNSRLAPIRASGTASFVPVAGHRYAVAGHIHVQSRDGADVDAGHTLSLDHVLLGPGLRLNSAASSIGAQFKVLSATRLSATRTGEGALILSYPSTTGFTYSVEFRNALSLGDWIPLDSRAGNDKVQTLTDSHGAESARFYRLRVE
jgi:hypothetical protein